MTNQIRKADLKTSISGQIPGRSEDQRSSVRKVGLVKTRLVVSFQLPEMLVVSFFIDYREGQTPTSLKKKKQRQVHTGCEKSYCDRQMSNDFTVIIFVGRMEKWYCRRFNQPINSFRLIIKLLNFFYYLRIFSSSSHPILAKKKKTLFYRYQNNFHNFINSFDFRYCLKKLNDAFTHLE